MLCGKKTVRKLDEIKSLRESSFESLDIALNKRYEVIEDLINYSRSIFDEDNRFIIKLLEAKLIPVKERFPVEKELIVGLSKLIKTISSTDENINSKELTGLRLSLAKSEKYIFEAVNNLNRLTKEYNEAILQFPQSIIAKARKIEPEPMVQVKYITR